MKLRAQPTKLKKAVINFLNDIEVAVVDGVSYPIVYTPSGVNNLYSLPYNDKYAPYTIKKKVDLNAVHDLKAVLKYWSIYKKGSIVYGEVKNGKFYIS